MWPPMDNIVLVYLLITTNVFEYTLQCVDYIADRYRANLND